jgi:hypothetical protein
VHLNWRFKLLTGLCRDAMFESRSVLYSSWSEAQWFLEPKRGAALWHVFDYT